MILSSAIGRLSHLLSFRESTGSNSFFKGMRRGLQKWTIRRSLGGVKQGRVFILGAGPGDPELLTLKAWRLIQSADVVLFDWLVSEELLRMIPASAIRQFVGKRCGQHSFEQQTICNLMVEHARLGRNVVRLKGGDPSVFGRLSEECEALQKAEIPFAIVPGITAAAGMAAYTGMPLTDRRYAQSVRFITATLKNPEDEPDWQAMVAASHQQKAQDTLVFYMGLKRVAAIASRLMEHGMHHDMPCALVDQATQKQQRLITGQLDNIAHLVRQQAVVGPALLVVGEVARHPWAVDLTLFHREAVTP